MSSRRGSTPYRISSRTQLHIGIQRLSVLLIDIRELGTHVIKAQPDSSSIILQQRYRACKYSVVAWFSRARAANSLYKKLIIR